MSLVLDIHARGEKQKRGVDTCPCVSRMSRGVHAMGVHGRRHAIDPNTGEPGQGSGWLRACCWLCGQVEARGPAGCYGDWDGDCWYSAELWTYQVSGLLQRYEMK